MKRLFSWLALPVLLTGIFFRFHALDRQSVWDDEMSTLKTISLDRRGSMYRFRTYECHPPLYFLQLRAWRKIGNRSLVKLRANSAFWGSVGLLLLYGLARFYGGHVLGLCALTLAAFSPFHLAYSQELRPYAFAMALATGSMWVVEVVLKDEGQALSRRWVFLLSLCWTALLWTHYWGFFVVIGQALYAFWRVGDFERRKQIGIAVGVSGLLFLPWTPVLASQISVVRADFWVQRFGISTLGKTLTAYCSLFFNMASWSFYLPLSVGLLLLIALIYLGALILGIRRGRQAGLLVWLGMLLGPWLLSFWRPELFVWYRYPTLMFPAFILLTAIGFCSMRPRWVLGVMLGVCLAAEGWGCRIYFTTWQKANPKIVVSYIHHIKTPAAVVVRPAYFSDLYRFYDHETTPAVDEHLYDSPQRRALLKTKQVLLVAFDVPQDDVTDAFLSEYKIVSRQHFPGFAHLGITVYDLRYP